MCACRRYENVFGMLFWPRPLGWSVADPPINMLLPHVLRYHMKFCRSGTSCLGVGRRIPKTFGDAGAGLLGWRRGWTHRNTLLPHPWHRPKFRHSIGQTTPAKLCRSARKWPIASRLSVHSMSLAQTRIERQPMTSYQWCIVTMGLSRTVSETNGDFDRKLHIFPTPCI